MRWHDWVVLVLLVGFFVIAGMRLWVGESPQCSERNVRYLVGIVGIEGGLIPVFANQEEWGCRE